MNSLPLIIEPEELEPHLGSENLLIIDLCKAENYVNGHVPGAIHLDYKDIIATRPPIMGLLPEPQQIEQLMSAIGLTDKTHVIAYDEEGGGKAARLLWTLDAIGHKHRSLLNGGLIAWANEHHPLEQNSNGRVERPNYSVQLNPAPVAHQDYILSHLQDENVAILDTRSPAEFNGVKKFAERAGHIPGAKNMDWVLLMDQNDNFKLKPAEQLKGTLQDLGITPDKTIVAYCQTHHRSALMYIALTHLGYTRVKGYPGSWSDWGNCADTPIEL